LFTNLPPACCLPVILRSKMKKKNLLFLLLFALSTGLLLWQRPFIQEDCLGGDLFTIQEFGQFKNPLIKESSGLCADGTGNYLTHNDDTDSCLYRIDRKGNDLGCVCIPANNTDWEELCRSNDGRFFIGDFGNNLNQRKDLQILILDPTFALSGRIQFSFEDQKSWPPLHPFAMDFDCEALVFHQDSLWLFTKNKDRKSGMVYVLPAKPGRYVARKCGEVRVQGTITAASLRPDGKELALLVYRKIYFFSLRNGLRQLASPDICLNAPLVRQSEAICYINNDRLLLSNEQGQLFLVKRK
jgi:hypothetical protein